jgi:hypothetical protein
MNKDNSIKFFGEGRIRTVWNDEEEKWYFSIVDIVAVLTESPEPRRYWSDLKIKLKNEGSEVYEKIVQLKLTSNDGKLRQTDVADTEQVLRIIQSIPSKKAEPFKLWLAKVGNERIDEISDPELAINRALETYKKKGYSDSWINQRLKSIEIRKDLTDEWRNRGIKKGREYAILTDEITKAWSRNTTKEYKKIKDLKKENLRDNMTNMELVLNMLAETTTTEISKIRKPEEFEKSRSIAKEGGAVAGNTRLDIEKRIGRSVITSDNSKIFNNNNGLLN